MPDYQSKTTCNQASVIASHKLSVFIWQYFNSTNHTYMFLWEILAAKVYEKIGLLFFSAISGLEIKKIAKVRAGSLSHLTASPLDSALTTMPLVLWGQTRACLQASNSPQKKSPWGGRRVLPPHLPNTDLNFQETDILSHPSTFL